MLKRGVPLTWRILAINIFVIVLLVGGFLYLDSYRTRLVSERQDRLNHEIQLLDAAIAAAPVDSRNGIIIRFAEVSGARVRLYRPDGVRDIDSFALAPPTFTLRDPAAQGWNRHIARAMDRFLDWAVGAPVPGPYQEPARDTAQSWPEIAAAQSRPGSVANAYRFAPDRTPVITSAMVSVRDGHSIMMLTNARDIIKTVRAERFQLGLILAAVTILSVLLSLFLGRTIVAPIQRLAEAAIRVRLGRDREVTVPRLPDRRDEIGALARALSDMTQALRARIDAGEDFAADVAHEIKNPLASLRSALEGLETIKDPALCKRLLSIAQDDVLRLDRLITDISEASRVDAELSRTRYERIDLGALIEPILAARKARAKAEDPRIAFARPRVGTAVVMGEPGRLARVIENLLDNARSFSPAAGVITIAATHAGEEVIIRVEDEGPGVPVGQRDLIFRRFHTDRPEEESFGKHSGLGLAIARTIIEAHDGSITALDREDRSTGACFEIRLPAASGALP